MLAQQEFHSLYQGDMSITEYTGHMKRLTVTLYDVDAAVTNQALIIDVLRSLNGHHLRQQHQHDPTPTFLYTHSYLLQKESRKAPHAQDGGRDNSRRR